MIVRADWDPKRDGKLDDFPCEKSDIYSFGMLLVELLVLDAPLQGWDAWRLKEMNRKKHVCIPANLIYTYVTQYV